LKLNVKDKVLASCGGETALPSLEKRMPNKKIPRRDSKIAEDYAKKVRMEPPKASRQEGPLVAPGKITARQHNPKKTVSRRRSPA
jgi:hypothetical protein